MVEDTTPLVDQNRKASSLSPATVALLVAPLVLLGLVIWVFLQTGGGLCLSSPAPVESLSIERTVLKPGRIEIRVRNTGPAPLTIAQVAINDALWPARIAPDPAIPRLGRATVHLDYPWVEGEAYAVALFSSHAIVFDTEIPVAFTTPAPAASTFLGLTLIGLYVGVIPVFLGFFWLPALRALGRRWMVFLLALLGLLGGFAPSPTLAVLFLGIGAGAILEVAYEIGRMIGRDTVKAPLAMTVFSGVMAGMLLLWVTGLLIK